MNFGVNLVDFTLDVVENAISNFREVQIWDCLKDDDQLDEY
jgi:hypothetical protein